MTSFEQATEVLKRHFHHDSFRPGQEEAVRSIMKGRDVLAVMSTGAGKSLIYQVPAVALGGTTIVISPLVSLMNDQVYKLCNLGLRPAFLNDTFNQKTQKEICRRIESGMYQILYVAPERLSNQMFLKSIANLNIPLIAVDEAHCISEWGHDFRSDYRKISSFIERIKPRPIVAALTATATPKVQQDIIDSLGLRSPLKAISSFDRSNLSLSVAHMPHDKRDAWCIRFARSRKDKCGIFYCVTISEAERTHDALERAGIPVTLYHGKLKHEERKEAQKAFKSGQLPVMVATSAFGMGIDKPDVRYVVCCGMPLSIESYYQQIGRAGRDGKPADTVMLWDEKDLGIARFMAKGDIEDRNDPRRLRREALVNRMRDFCQAENVCRRDLILRYFGEKVPHDGGCGRCDNCIKPIDNVVHAEEAAPLTTSERVLFANLEQACAKLAVDDNPESVLSRRALRGICHAKPRNIEQLLAVKGVTAKTARAYGAQILAVVETGALPSAVQPVDMPDVPDPLAKALISTVYTLGEEARRPLVLKVACGKSDTKTSRFEKLPCWGSAGVDRAKAKWALDILICCGKIEENPAKKILFVPATI